MAGKPGAGALSHKNPDCRCYACAARRRKAEAVPEPAGAGRSPMESTASPTTPTQISADFPLFGQGHSPKERIMQWLEFRAAEPGITNNEVARRMGIEARTLNGYISRATKEGWLRFDDAMSRVEHEIIPKTLDNMSMFLSDRDKKATIETFKSTIARLYLESKGVSDAAQTMLTLNIEMVDPAAAKVIQGTVVGKPKELKE